MGGCVGELVKVFPSLFIKNCVRGAKERLGYLASRLLMVWFSPPLRLLLGCLASVFVRAGLLHWLRASGIVGLVDDCRGRLQSLDDLMSFAAFSSWLFLGYTPLESGVSSFQRSRSA